MAGHGCPGARCVSGANKRSAPEILSASDLRSQTSSVSFEERVKNEELCVKTRDLGCEREIKSRAGTCVGFTAGPPDTHNK